MGLKKERLNLTTKGFKVLFPAILTGLLLYSCASDDKALQNEKNTNPNSVDSHQFMINTLDSINRNSQPFDYYHWNLKQASVLKQQLGIGQTQQQVSTWFSYCNQLLYGGETEECIHQIEQYLNSIGPSYDQILNDRTRPAFELLAIAYMRKGEQENCCANHSSKSCIVPIQSTGLHQNTAGSQKAIELYSLLYDKYPMDKYKWLINLAYMTLGEYPQSVQPKYYLKIPKFREDEIKPFENLALQKNVAASGLAGGACVEDFNGDGLLDIFATSYDMFDNVKLFIQNSDGSFSDKTHEANLTGILGGLNSIHSDYNNDGFIDILVLRGGWLPKGTHPNSLLKNNGDGTFTDVTKSSGILSFHPTQTAAWGDFNNDGFLDLFIGNESGSGYKHACELYENNGDGTFQEVSNQHGLNNVTGFVKGVSWGDIDNDGFIDLYISVLGGKNKLFKNKEGHFTDIAGEAGVESPFFSFPCWFWDVNNDGYQDLFVGSYDVSNHDNVADDYAKELQGKTITTEKPKLFLNNGNGTFVDVSAAYNISKTMYCMGSNFGDFDNDGFLDFYIGTGAPDFSTIVPNRMFRNAGGKKFNEVTFAGGFGHIQKGHGIAFADLDNDGDQDIYAVMGGAYEGDRFQNALFINPGNSNNWITVKVSGSKDRCVTGAKLKLILDSGRTLYRTIGTGSSFGSNPLQVTVGIGSAEKVLLLEVKYTNGASANFENIDANKSVTIVENNLLE